MIDFDKMNLTELKALQIKLSGVIEKKSAERQRKIWDDFKEAYINYVGEFGPIVLTLEDSDNCEYEEDLGIDLIFSAPGELSLTEY